MSESTRTSAAAATKVTAAAAARANPTVVYEGKAIIRQPPKQESESDKTAGTDAAAAAATAVTSTDNDSMSIDDSAGLTLTHDGQPVFYNKVQVFNRDLSITVIQTYVDELKDEWEAAKEKRREKEKKRERYMATTATSAGGSDAAAAAVAPAAASASTAAAADTTTAATAASDAFPGITILEALSATGLRSIRYYKEISDVSKIIVNDCSAEAVRSIEYNLAANGISTQQCTPSHNDAITLMQQYRSSIMGPPKQPKPNVIDLDPYGTATPFLDSAVQALSDGGLLAVTCTDAAILCGNHSEACWAKYGVMPLKGQYCHESAVRVLLSTISTAANRYGRYIVPMLSMSIDFYVRVFVRVFSGPSIVKLQASQVGMIMQCVGCESFFPHPLGRIKTEGASVKYTPNVLSPPLSAGCKCPHCQSSVKMGGPFWLGPLHYKPFLQRALARVTAKENEGLFATQTRIIGSLTVCSEELQQGEEEYFNRVLPSRIEKLKQEKKAAAAADSAVAAAAAPKTTAATTAASSSAATSKPSTSVPALPPVSSLLFYSPSLMFQIVGASCPKLTLVRSAIFNAGYAVSQTHCMHNGLKTNAPAQVMWDIIRCYIHENPVVHGQRPGSIGERIMSTPPTLKADWTFDRRSDMSSTASGVAKFLPNPEEHWGPKARAGTKRKAADPQPRKRTRARTEQTGKIRQCKFFGATGECKFGDNCKYAHIPGLKAGELVPEHMRTATATANANEDSDAEENGAAEEADATKEAQEDEAMSEAQQS